MQAAAGDQVTLTEPGSPITFVGSADASGDWVFTPTTPLAIGTNTLLATVTDGFGDTATAMADITIQAGAAVAIDGLVDGTALPSGETTDQTPTLYGTGTPGQTVTLSDGNTSIGSATRRGRGSTPSFCLVD